MVRRILMKKELTDRRQSGERRGAKRYSVSIEIDFDRTGERHLGTISDLSEGGCFVLSGVEVTDGEEIGIYLPIGDGMKAQIGGVITNHVYEIGFAVRFTVLSEPQRNVLRNYLLNDADTV